jgi:hypothetical protein
MQADPALDGDFELLASSPRRLSRRVQLVLLILVLLVATVGGMRWLTQRDQPVRITAYGQPVADPRGVLQAAEQGFQSYTMDRHGVLGSGARCWFQREPGSSDIAGTLLCGPVLFYDDDPNAPYLRFPLIAHGTGSPVRLEAQARPTTPEPGAASSDVTLLRPDATAHPLRSAGFSAPIPPPADPNTLTATDAVHPAELVQAAPSAVIGSDSITLTLTGSGQVDDFGTGSAELSTPDGRQLFAFRIAFDGGENGFARPSQVDFGVSVGSAPPRRLHLGDASIPGPGQLFVVASPPGAPLDLVLTEHGITQRLSLRDGTPAPGNITFLQSPHGVDPERFAINVPAVVTVAGHPENTQLFVQLDSVDRQFFVPGSAAHPPEHDHVFLFLSLVYRTAVLPGSFGFATPDILTLTPRGGSALHGKIINGSATPLFDVPVDMTEATITLAGSEAHLGYTLSFPNPVSFPLRLTPEND